MAKVKVPSPNAPQVYPSANALTGMRANIDSSVASAGDQRRKQQEITERLDAERVKIMRDLDAKIAAKKAR